MNQVTVVSKKTLSHKGNSWRLLTSVNTAVRINKGGGFVQNRGKGEQKDASETHLQKDQQRRTRTMRQCKIEE